MRDVAIHETFNRAVNIHATQHVTVSGTCIYNIMGGAFFLEDGIETHNVFIVSVFAVRSDVFCVDGLGFCGIADSHLEVC